MARNTEHRFHEPCEICGLIHTVCCGHTKAGNPCKKKPPEGYHVCNIHGGATPRSVALRQRTTNTRLATAYLASLDLNPDDYLDPMDAILEELTMASREVEFVGAMIAELGIPNFDDESEGGPFRNLVGVNEDGSFKWRTVLNQVLGLDHNRDLTPHTLIPWWHAARDRKLKAAKISIELGLAERIVKVTEGHAQQFVQVIMAVIQDPVLALTPEQQAAARISAAREMRVIEATSEAVA